jgi:hypothetical protein
MGGTSNPSFQDVLRDTVSAVLSQTANRSTGTFAKYRPKEEQHSLYEKMLRKWDSKAGVWKAQTASVNVTTFLL